MPETTPSTVRYIREQYSVQFSIGQNVLTNNIQSFTIINSIKSIYPIFNIKVIVDSREYFNNKIYGQENAKMDFLVSNNVSVGGMELTSVDLFIVHMDVPLSLKMDESGDKKQEEPINDIISIIAIAKNPYLTMATTVNKVFTSSSTNGKEDSNTPIKMVESIFDKFIKTKVTKNISDKKANKTSIFQTVIPSMSFIKSIRFINDNYGLYDGAMFVFCDMFNNFNLHCIGAQFKEQPLYEVAFLASGKDDAEVYNRAKNEKNFTFTYSTITSKNKTNNKLLKYASNFASIVKPIDKFFELKEHKLEDSVDQTLLLNDEMKFRSVMFYGNTTGGESDSKIKSLMSSILENSSTIKFNLGSNSLNLELLSQIGKPVLISPQSIEYLSFSGKYIIGVSVINFSKASSMNYDVSAEIHAFRPNIEEA